MKLSAFSSTPVPRSRGIVTPPHRLKWARSLMPSPSQTGTTSSRLTMPDTFGAC